VSYIDNKSMTKCLRYQCGIIYWVTSVFGLDFRPKFRPKWLKVDGKLGLVGNKSTSYAWTCLFNCAAHANDML